jgi:hypothetical protein
MNAVHVMLRVLVVLNWVSGAAIAILLFIAPNEQWIMRSLELVPSPEADRVVRGLRAIAALGLAAIPLNHVVLRRLQAIVGTVRARNAFAAANVSRAHAIAWSLVALQVLSIAIGVIAARISSPAHPIDVDAGFSKGGWLAVLLTFVMARVFAEGSRTSSTEAFQ